MTSGFDAEHPGWWVKKHSPRSIYRDDAAGKDADPTTKWTFRIGQMLDMASFPCTPKPEVWVKSFFSAIPVLLMTPIKPTPTDYIAVRYGNRHNMKRKFTFDVWDHESNLKMPGTGPSWVPFRAGGLALRALWWLSIGEAVSEFALAWMSTAYQWSGCAAPGTAFAQTHWHSSTVFGPTDDWERLNLWDVDARNIFGAGGSFITTPGGYTPSIGFSLNWFPRLDLSPIIPEPTFMVVDSFNDSKLFESGTKGGWRNTYGTDHFYDGALQQQNPHQYGVYMKNGGGFGQITNGWFTAYGGNPYAAMRPDP